MSQWQVPVLMLVAVFVGGLLPLQGGLNAQLSLVLRNPWLASLISFMVGTLILALIVLVSRVELPSLAEWRRVPWYLLLGGSIGAAFVTLVILLAPKIGIANILAAAIFGQLLMSAVLDHFGWLGVAQQSLSASRVAGILLLLVGVWLVQRS